MQYPDLENPDLDIRTKALTQMGTEWVFTSASLFEAEYHARLETDSQDRTVANSGVQLMLTLV